MTDKCCENCIHWYCGRNGGSNGTYSWAECKAIVNGTSEIEIKFFNNESPEFYAETRNDFYCALWQEQE